VGLDLLSKYCMNWAWYYINKKATVITSKVCLDDMPPISWLRFVKQVLHILGLVFRLVELYGTVRLRSVRYAPYLLNYGVLP